jgi:ATP-binding cassette subfamily B protein
VLIMGYLAQLYVPVQTVSASIARWQSSLASAERAFDLLDETADVTERPNAKPLARARGAITFNRVSFSYDGRSRALRDVSFEAAPGTRVGLSGPTGAGKTTLVSLLMRLYDPTDGGILLDGVDLRDYRIADLRNQFAVVLQEPVLFSASIVENIAYARPDAAEREIIKAAKAADIHDFVMSLPNGYQTMVGERGMSVSGGERQRISLARAFLRDAPVLVLDEPTSSVDVKTEAVIVDAMERLMRGRTCFFISHRLSTLRSCDLQLRIENGELRGTTLHDAPSSLAG